MLQIPKYAMWDAILYLRYICIMLELEVLIRLLFPAIVFDCLYHVITSGVWQSLRPPEYCIYTA